MTTVSSSLRSRLVGRSIIAAFRRLRGNEELTGETSIDDLAAYMHSMRPKLESIAARAPVPRNVILTQIEDGPCAGEWTRLERAAPDVDRVTMHVHGGAYALGSPVTHRGIGRSLAKVTGGRVWMPDYRLAPDHPYPAALDDVFDSYCWLVDKEGIAPEHLAVSGDSAGGGLAVALLLRLRDEGAPLPACYVGLSPWVDLAATGGSIVENNGRDALFGQIDVGLASKLGRLYSGDCDVRDPYVSPLYGDLTGLPPMLVHVGEAELIRDDGVRLVDRARAQGVDASVGVFQDMWHVFQALPIPESTRSFREIGGFIKRHTGG